MIMSRGNNWIVKIKMMGPIKDGKGLMMTICIENFTQTSLEMKRKIATNARVK